MKKTVVLVYIKGSAGEVHPAIYYLTAYAKQDRDDIRFVTKTFSPQEPVSAMLHCIEQYHPALVGFSTYLWNKKATLGLVRKLKRKLKNTPIILGGAEASYRARAILSAFPEIDLIARDEAEETFTELVNHYCDGRGDLAAIKGITYRGGGCIRETGARQPIDLATVSSPFLVGVLPVSKLTTVTYETSRGCPYKCAYCSYNTGSYAAVRFFPLSRVRPELSLILGKSPRRVDVVDDNFNINEERAQQILAVIHAEVKRNTVVTLFLRADVWKISSGLAKQLSHRNIFCTIGVQTLNLATLTSAKRIHNRDNLESNLRLLNEYKVKYTLQFIVGLPGDRYRDVKQMIDWAFQYQPYDIHLQTLRINPQTVYEKKTDAFGIAYRHTPPYTISRTASMTPYGLKRSERLAATFQAYYRRRSLRKEIIRIHAETRLPVSQIIEKIIRKGSRQRPVMIFSLFQPLKSLPRI